MTKVILIDADGVALKKHEYFSARLARDLRIPLEKVLPFFTQEFPQCSLGEADLKEIIEPHLSEWGWQDSVDDLLNIWFTFEDQPDTEVLSAVAAWRGAGVLCYMASDQEKYRAEYIRQSIGDQFDGAFFSCELGLKKSNPAFFQAIADKLEVELSEIAYLDDDPKNIAVASALGIQAEVYEDVADLTKIRTHE